MVIAQKVVSKAEGRIRRLSSRDPGAEATPPRRQRWARSRPLVELILDESKEVLRAERGVLITETHHGFVCANAGIDTSNLPERRHGLPAARGPRRLGPQLRADLTAAMTRGPGWGLGQKRDVRNPPGP